MISHKTTLPDSPPVELRRVRDWLRWGASSFGEHGISFGHGTTNAYDEAAWLVLYALHLEPNLLEPYLDAQLTGEECSRIFSLLLRRISERRPAAYLLNHAWLEGRRFYVDERVLVPRSPLAQLITQRLAPWWPQQQPARRILDMGTGSGCLAILLAQTFPEALVDGCDISKPALEVAQRNVQEYRLGNRLTLIESDLFAKLAPAQRYDIIIANPPYVTSAAMTALPAEYRCEPGLALDGGADGMRVVKRLVREAALYLEPHGVLLVEVGHNRIQAEAALAELPLCWVAESADEAAIFVVQGRDLNVLESR